MADAEPFVVLAWALLETLQCRLDRPVDQHDAKPILRASKTIHGLEIPREPLITEVERALSVRFNERSREDLERSHATREMKADIGLLTTRMAQLQGEIDALRRGDAQVEGGEAALGKQEGSAGDEP